jgi:hypothetical protein
VGERFDRVARSGGRTDAVGLSDERGLTFPGGYRLSHMPRRCHSAWTSSQLPEAKKGACGRASDLGRGGSLTPPAALNPALTEEEDSSRNPTGQRAQGRTVPARRPLAVLVKPGTLRRNQTVRRQATDSGRGQQIGCCLGPAWPAGRRRPVHTHGITPKRTKKKHVAT